MGVRGRVVGAIAGVIAIAVTIALVSVSSDRHASNIIITPPASAAESSNQMTTAVALTRAHWSVQPPSPLHARGGPALVWDGRELIEIGGTIHGVPQRDGAAFDPARSTWRRIAPAPIEVGTFGAMSVWTGRDVFMYGGQSSSNKTIATCCVAGLFDPAKNRWVVSSRAPLDKALRETSVVWTGGSVVIAGLTPGRSENLEVATYDPVTDRWARLDPTLRKSHPPLSEALVATNDSVVLWSLWSRARQTGPGSFAVYSGIDVFWLNRSGTWTDVTDGWPQHETVSNPQFTGTKILLAPGQIWCGACSHPAPINERGFLVDPATLELTAIPHGPLDDLGPQVIWTGAAEISLNAGGEISGPGVSVRPGDIAVWDPKTGRWKRGPRPPTSLEYQTPAVWAVNRLFALATDGRLLKFGT